MLNNLKKYIINQLKETTEEIEFVGDKNHIYFEKSYIINEFEIIYTKKSLPTQETHNIEPKFKGIVVIMNWDEKQQLLNFIESLYKNPKLLELC